MFSFLSPEFWTGSDPYTVSGPAQTSQQSRYDQTLLADALRKRAAGQAPSAAEILMKGGMAQAQNQAAGQAAAQRGLNPALAARMAMRTGASIAGDIGGKMGALRAQEQAMAEQALMQMLQAQRGQDINEWQVQQQINAQQQPGGAGFLGNLLGTAAQGAAAYFGNLPLGKAK